MVRRSVNKRELVRELGVSRGSLYYISKREGIDQELKKQSESVMADHLDYGHKRVALHLKMGHNRIRRVMKKYGLKPYRRKSKKPIKKADQGSEYDSEDFIQFVKMIESTWSMSAKGSPWQNGHQESFFGHFKQDSGDLS